MHFLSDTIFPDYFAWFCLQDDLVLRVCMVASSEAKFGEREHHFDL